MSNRKKYEYEDYDEYKDEDYDEIAGFIISILTSIFFSSVSAAVTIDLINRILYR